MTNQNSKNNKAVLKELRAEIDRADNQILSLLSKRIDIVKKIGELKKAQGIKPLDKARFNKLLENKLAQAKNLNLREDFIKDIFHTIHKHSLREE